VVLPACTRTSFVFFNLLMSRAIFSRRSWSDGAAATRLIVRGLLLLDAAPRLTLNARFADRTIFGAGNTITYFIGVWFKGLLEN